MVDVFYWQWNMAANSYPQTLISRGFPIFGGGIHLPDPNSDKPTLPLAQTLDVSRAAIAKPAVELGDVLELLAAQTRDDDEPAIHFR